MSNYSESWDEQTETSTQINAGGVVVEIPSHVKKDFYPALTARSGMFGAQRTHMETSEEMNLQPRNIYAPSGYEIIISGPTLNMFDKQVWEIALLIAIERQEGIGHPFLISLRDFATRLGIPTGGSQTNQIYDCLRRLSKTHIEIKAPYGGDVMGSIISSIESKKNEKGVIKEVAITLSNKVVSSLLKNENQFFIQVPRREKLKSMTAKILHDYISTQNGYQEEDAEGKQMVLTKSVKDLKSLAGYTDEDETRRFFAQLKDAMVDLVKVAPELVKKWEIVEKGRKADGWDLRIYKGSEKPSFKPPESIKLASESKPKYIPKGKFKPQSGVSL